MANALQPFIDQHVISGGVTIVATKDKILDEEAFGLADVETQRPMTTDSLFAIASMTKPMTITALIMLVEEGQVSLDDPVEKYLPEFKGQMVAVEHDADHVLLRKPQRPMLVRDLMCHLSGLPKRVPCDSFIKADSLPLATWVKMYASLPLESEPGTHYDYSNPGINTAGRIVEVVSREPYEKFMQDRLFKPLGMKDTTFIPNQEQLSRLASLYMVKPDHSGLEKVPPSFFTYPLDNPHRSPIPSAGLFSTAGDILKFCQMFLSRGTYEGRQYLKPETVDMVTRIETPASVGAQRGYPWAENLGKDREAYGHGGAYRTYMIIDPKENLIGILMLQHVGGWSTPDETVQEKMVYPTFIQKVYDVAGIPASVGKSPEP
jgi:CubicO group peptidase (beta-lactamase class C family)